MLKILCSLFLLILALAGFSPASAQTPDLRDPSQQQLIRMNNLSIDKVNKEIRISVRLAITDGILEYLLVGEAGKTYESVFKVVENKPSDLNFALLLIGAEPLDFNTLNELLKKKNGLEDLTTRHRSSLVDITLYKDGQPVHFDRLLKNRERTDGSLRWVFTGGAFLEDNRYAADFELSYIGIWPDPYAVVNLFSNLKNPYRGDYGYEMNPTGGYLTDQEFEIVIRRVAQ